MGILGADETRNRLLAKVAASVSEGEGGFSQTGPDSGIGVIDAVCREKTLDIGARRCCS